MIDDFLLRALIAGVVIALAAAPLGCLVVWRRMAYFGDATGHAGLLGVALGLALGLPMTLGVAMLAGAMALVVTYMMQRGDYAVDTVLGVFAHSALAIGLVAASLLPGVRLNLMETLLGDILSVSWVDIWVISLGAVGILGVMAWRWRSLLNGTLSPELLVAEGGSLMWDRLIFTLTLAMFVALAMKLVGVLLITAMLILPAAAARTMARSPEQMVVFAGIIGVSAVAVGLGFSWVTDAPAGPSIVVMSSVGFVLSNLVKLFKN
mgnify:FL=1